MFRCIRLQPKYFERNRSVQVEEQPGNSGFGEKYQ